MLAETVVEAARRFGERPALVAEGGWPVSYADLDSLSNEVAAGLRDLGVGPGDVVALVLPSCPEHFVAYAALAKLGALTAAVNGRLAPPERAAALDLIHPKAVLAAPDLSGGVSGGGSLQLTVTPAGGPGELLRDLRVRGASPPALASDPDRPVAVVFTSGTTGTPKGVTFAGRQLAHITFCDVGEGFGGGGPSLAGSALAHLGPMTKWPGSLRRGATQYLTTTWRAAEALRRIDELKVAAIGGVPTQLALMLGQPDFDAYDVSSVRAIVIGGGPATPALVREARQRFGAALAVRYSCTEAGIGTGTGLQDPDDDAEVSVGRPQPGVSVTIVDEEGRRVPDGEVGEVCLRSPAVMSGYFSDPVATAGTLTEDGSVRTGDLGWLDGAGRLRLSGRASERYVRAGFNVSPMEVETVLADHPDVSAVAVVGCPDPVMGEVGVVAVVPAPGRPAPTLESLRAFGGERLARYKLPDAIAVLDALPLTAMDKLDRRALAGELARGGHQGTQAG